MISACAQNRSCLSALAFVLCAFLGNVCAQDSTATILRDYQSARTAFSSRDFKKSSELFHSVSSQCPGSELALQCDFLCALSDWNRDPNQHAIQQFEDWSSNYEAFKERSRVANRSYDEASFSKWNSTAQSILAKWDRGAKNTKSAENRLRRFLKYGSEEVSAEPVVRAAECWLELGNLLIEEKRNDQESMECFRRAIEQADGSTEIFSRANYGCAVACCYREEFQNARSYLSKIDRNLADDSFAIQIALLEHRISKRLDDSATAVKPLDPAIRIALRGNPQASILYELATTVLQTEDRAAAIELFTEVTKRFPESNSAQDSRLYLSRNATENSDWKQAIVWCTDFLNQGGDDSLQLQAKLMRGVASMGIGQFRDAQADFEQLLALSNLSLDYQIAIRFRLAECLYNLGQWNQAEPQWNWLLSNRSAFSSDDRQDMTWYPVALLRTAELHALKRDWSKAESIVLRIREDFFECSNRTEVDYLYARCLISKAEFDAAREVLHEVETAAKNHSQELVARSRWMTGETFLMQRRFAEAQHAYRSVLEVPKLAYWHSAALLQMGQCAESLNEVGEARQAYDRLVKEFPGSPFCSVAQERLGKLPKINLALQNGLEPSGNKR